MRACPAGPTRGSASQTPRQTWKKKDLSRHLGKKVPDSQGACAKVPTKSVRSPCRLKYGPPELATAAPACAFERKVSLTKGCCNFSHVVAETETARVPGSSPLGQLQFLLMVETSAWEWRRAPASDSSVAALHRLTTQCWLRSQPGPGIPPVIRLCQVRKQKMYLDDSSEKAVTGRGGGGAVTQKGTRDAHICDIFLCVCCTTQPHLQCPSRSRSFPKTTDS